MKKVILVTVLFITVISILSCSPEQEQADPDLVRAAGSLKPLDSLTENIETVVVLGNPLNLIQGAALSPDWQKATSDFQNWGNIILRNVLISVEKNKIKPETFEDLKEAQITPSGVTSRPPTDTFQLKSESNGRSVLRNRENSGILSKQVNQEIKFWYCSLLPTSPTEDSILEDPEKCGQMSLLHQSTSLDSPLMSLLFQAWDAELGDVLIVFYFEKLPSTWVAPVPETYPYALGYGLPYRWEKTIRLDLCGGAAVFADLLNEAIKLWEAVTPEVSIESQVLEKYPPFTDLNSHCLYLVPDYVLEHPKSTGFTGAQTRIVGSSSKFSFVDSDIMIFEKVLTRLPKDDRNHVLTHTLRHELGHFLGLGHQFKEPSLMGYDHEVLLPTPYDHKFLDSLYK